MFTPQLLPHYSLISPPLISLTLNSPHIPTFHSPHKPHNTTHPSHTHILQSLTPSIPSKQHTPHSLHIPHSSHAHTTLTIHLPRLIPPTHPPLPRPLTRPSQCQQWASARGLGPHAPLALRTMRGSGETLPSLHEPLSPLHQDGLNQKSDDPVRQIWQYREGR